MTEYGAPITTSETYCRDTARKATQHTQFSCLASQGYRVAEKAQGASWDRAT